MAAREFSFTSFQANNPTAPPPGDRLDGEFDRLAKTLATLPPPSPVKIGKNQLEPGLFDQIGTSILARIEALAATVQGLLGEARTIALGTLAAAGVARAQNALAQDAAQRSSSEAQAAASSALAAAASADQAEAFYIETGNAARDTAGDVATCQDYADVTYAWAEYMPGPIPPNILAVMGISGDHWSSRFWANQASQIFDAHHVGPAGPPGPASTVPGPAGPTGATGPAGPVAPAGQVTGTATNDNATAGNVGEVISAVLGTPAAVANGATVTIASVSLTPGDWDVSGEVWFQPGGTAANAVGCGINTVAATMPPAPAIGTAQNYLSLVAGGTWSYTAMPLAPVRASLAATTTYYVVATQSSGIGTTAFGKIFARRVR